MKLFSNRHNLRLDDAAKRNRNRQIAGGIVLTIIAAEFVYAVMLLMAGERI